MRITRLKIENFRAISSLDIALGGTTVLIGQNNTGKTAILDAVRFALTRRWGERGTGFTEHDIYRRDVVGDPRSAPPVTIEVTIEEPSKQCWDQDLIADLDTVLRFLPDGRYVIKLRVSCSWNEEKNDFEPKWEFLNADGSPITGRTQRAINFSPFFDYLPFYWLGALRDADDEFAPRSAYWGRYLRGVRIPRDVEEQALKTLESVDASIIGADPALAALAEAVGLATHVAIDESPGSARLSTLPLSVEDLLRRASIVVRNQDSRPWLPLDHHGQGLQSLAVIFLFQAVIEQQIAGSDRNSIEPVFGIEEPEAHLHPQAARTLWRRLQALRGQKLITTHSPFFLQNVPLADVRLLRLEDGSTKAYSLPLRIESGLPWTTRVDTLASTKTGVLEKSPDGTRVTALSSFNESFGNDLKHCYRKESDPAALNAQVDELHHESRVLVSADEERSLAFHGRRVRGEIFFARRWILVEGVCDYLLLQGVAEGMGWSLDQHGVVAIDFQRDTNPGTYAALATAFHIDWHVIVDGDSGGGAAERQLLSRGFDSSELALRLRKLASGNDVEAQLMADGHEQLLREIMEQAGFADAKTWSTGELLAKLRNRKTTYMSILAERVSQNGVLAASMPQAYVSLVKSLRDGLL